jgi:hypothetical protein
MLVKESFKDFLTTGNFKNIPLGITRKEFVELLGKTDCIIQPEQTMFPCVYKYGIVEFYFGVESVEDKLYGIMLQPEVAPCKKGNLILDLDAWDKHLTIDKAREYLKQNNIPFSETNSEPDDEGEYDIEIKTINGIKIFFCPNYNVESIALTFFELERFNANYSTLP